MVVWPWPPAKLSPREELWKEPLSTHIKSQKPKATKQKTPQKAPTKPQTQTKWCKGNCSLPPTSRPMYNQSLINFYPITKHLLYCWAWYCIAQNIPLVSWVSCPSCVPPQLLGHPRLLIGGVRMRNRECLDEMSSDSKNNGVLSRLFWSQIWNTTLDGVLWRKLTPP